MVVSARLWVDGVEVMPDATPFNAVPWHPEVFGAVADLYGRAR